MDSGNQTPADQVKVNDNNPTFVTASGAADGKSPRLEIGDLVAEKYKIIELLGHGGMGSVYKVEQIFFRQFFALKTLTGQNFPDVAIRRFQKEAQAASKLNHPNLVRAYDFGILGTHQPFFVMDLIEGENLSDYSKRVGTLPIEEILQIFIPVCFALGYAHSEGIVHRDIKPGNIMLDKSAGTNEAYVPKVVDFGIAKLTDNEGGHSVNLTRTGEIFGTPLYMSPEQCLGTKIDHRTDIYSIGCVMYEALTGAPPFHGESALSLMMKHQSEQPQSLKEASLGREFPEALEAIVARTMEKNPDLRYQNLLDLAQDLAVLQQGRAGSTENVTIAKTQPHFAKLPAAKTKPISQKLIAAVGLVCLAIGIVLGLIFSPKPEEVVKYIERPIDENSASDEAELLGYIPIVKVEGRGPSATRLYRFPKTFSIGTFTTVDKLNQQSKPKQAKGEHTIAFDKQFHLRVTNKDLIRHPQLLRGFGEYDVNALHLDNVTQQEEEAVLYNPDITFDASIVYCSNWKALIHLIAYGTTLSDVGLRCVQDLPYLINVDVTGTRVTADGFKQLKTFPDKIAGVGIGGMPAGKTLIPELSKSKVLTTVNFSKLDLADHDVKMLANTRSLVMLNLQENPKVTDQAIASLKNLTNLFKLDIAGTSVTSASIPVLASFSKLRVITLDGDHWTAKDVKKLQSLLPKAALLGLKVDPIKQSIQPWDWKKEL